MRALRLDELRIGLAHELDQRRYQPPHQRLGGAQHLGVAHGAAHDAAQDVAAALVRRVDAIGDQEGRGAQVVGDDAMARRLRPVRVDAGEVRDSPDDGAHQVDVVVRRDTLQDGRDALEPHAGVDRRARQRRRGWPGPIWSYCMKTRFQNSRKRSPSSSALPGGPPQHRLALVVEDLRAGAAGPRVAGGPEIVRGRDPDDAARPAGRRSSSTGRRPRRRRGRR